jgi:hypothetical protein
MHDDIFERDGREEGSHERPERPAETPGPLADREVPLSAIATSDVIHRWLDGELPEPAGARGDAGRTVDFWHRIGVETERRRSMVTPAHVPAQIMAAISSLNAAPVPVPWWKKDVHLSAARTMALVVGAFALGILVMRALGTR